MHPAHYVILDVHRPRPIYEGEEGTVTLIYGVPDSNDLVEHVVDVSIDLGTPERRPTMSDPGEPAEGGELHISTHATDGYELTRADYAAIERVLS